ncbi:cobalamin B12-binding domain-containing protein, partial [Streptomyces sp. A7024]
PPATTDRSASRGLVRAAERLDAPRLDTQLRALIGKHGLVDGWERVMAPALQAAGRRWEADGDAHVEEEHLLSWHISTVLRTATAPDPDPAATPDAPPVVLACVPGEMHTLALESLTAALIERGVPTRMFGAAVPAEAVTKALHRLGPAAVVLWSQTRSTANRPLAQHIHTQSWGMRGTRRHTTVLTAGPGWTAPT